MTKLPETHQKVDHDHSGNGLPSYISILDDICQEEGIAASSLSNGWVTLLEKAGKRRLILGYKFGLNAATSSMVADDKYATFEALRGAGVPIIKHALLYEENRTEEYTRAFRSRKYIEDFLQQNHNHIVIKPNNGQCGINVHQVKSMQEVEEILPTVFHQCASASMCPFYEIEHEYRVIVLDSEMRLCYQKTHGEDWRFNLHQGAKAEKVQDEGLKERLVALALRAVWALNLRFCSVDIIKTVDGELLIMEVNSGVMTDGYVAQHPEDAKIVKEIYKDAILKMFQQS